MGTEELALKQFSREKIRNRMVKRAAEAWGYPESEMDDFDPLVSLLLEACAVEFEKTAGEIGKSQNRMLERLAQLLYPGMMEVNPAFGILQVRSAEPVSALFPEDQFFYTPVITDRKRDNAPAHLFFSPVSETAVFDGKIACMGSGRELFATGDGIQKIQLAASSKKIISRQHSLWFGLDLQDEISSLNQISFFFNWINEPEADKWYSCLPFAEWYFENQLLTRQPGLPPRPAAVETQNKLEREFDSMNKIEEQVRAFFDRNFITLTSDIVLSEDGNKRQNHPKAFEEIYSKKELQELKEPLWWIECRFPQLMPVTAIDGLLCSMNAVPVINRKLNKFTYKLSPSVNIVPLETDGIFLAVKEILNSQGQQVSLMPLANTSELMPETFTLRFGMNRFDERNLNETLVNLTGMIKEESAYFSSLGEDFLLQHIRELNQVLARIEGKLKMQNKNQSPYPSLSIKSGKESGNVSVAFWSCNGAAVNKIPTGTPLTPYKSSNVQSNSLFLITTTHGGRNKYSDAEKIDQYKKSLLTHNRIVSLEDLKQFVETELGSAAKSVEYSKTYTKGFLPGEGFIRCMKISIHPEPGILERREWEQHLRLLKEKLEKQSANHIPYLFYLADYA